MEELEHRRKILISKLKHEYAQKFPNSPLLPLILSLPDQIEPSELIGQALILLDLLDNDRANNLNLQRKKGMIK